MADSNSHDENDQMMMTRAASLSLRAFSGRAGVSKDVEKSPAI